MCFVTHAVMGLGKKTFHLLLRFSFAEPFVIRKQVLA
jgi:hypothetical protein